MSEWEWDLGLGAEAVVHSQAGVSCSIRGEQGPRGRVPGCQPAALCQVQACTPLCVDTSHSSREEVWKRFPCYVSGFPFGKGP